MHLIRFNAVDWGDARSALLRELEVLALPDVSVSGKWTRIHILRATGHIEDALKADELAKQLGESRGRKWRLIESLCATDPCDPGARRPVDFVAARRYDAISFDNLDKLARIPRGDVIFNLARPAMARFDRDRAVAKHREYVEAIISIADRGYEGLRELSSHNALLAPSHVCILHSGIEVGTNRKDDLDRWFSTQLRMVLMFPLLNGSEQVDALAKAGTEPMLDLIENLHEIDGDAFEDRLKEAYCSEDEKSQFALSVVGCLTETPIRSGTKSVIRRLLEAPSERVRANAMGVVARLDDIDLLRYVVFGKWHASGKRYDDDCYGSEVLVSSVQKRLVGHTDALQRMNPCYYGLAAMKWRAKDVVDVARHIDLSIRKASGLRVDFNRDLEVDMEHRGGLRWGPKPSDDAIFDRNEDGFQRFSLGIDEIRRREKILLDKFEIFKRKIRPDSYVILDCFDLDEFRAVADAHYGISDSWYELFVEMSDSQLRVVYNLVLGLGYSLGYRCADKAVRLFSRVKRCKPMISVWYGKARVSIDALSIWGGADAEELNSLRFCRLDDTSNDYQISQEVLAAHLKGRENLIQKYIETKLNREEPAEKARALMAAGFSDKSEFNDCVLDKYRNAAGFVGKVSSAAIYAYERNAWARYWYSKMCKAKDSVEFWRMSVLFLKIVDGRYDLWFSDSEYEDPMKRFWPNLRYALRRRMNKWKSLRENTLFGGGVPKEWFLSYRRDL